MNLGRRITRPEAALGLQALTGVAFGLGALMLIAAGPATAAIGLPRTRTWRLLVRAAGLRDLALGALLATSLSGRSRDSRRTASALVATAQVADLGTAALLFASGSVGWRALATVAAGAVPTILLALAVFDNYRTE